MKEHNHSPVWTIRIKRRLSFQVTNEKMDTKKNQNKKEKGIISQDYRTIHNEKENHYLSRSLQSSKFRERYKRVKKIPLTIL